MDVVEAVGAVKATVADAKTLVGELSTLWARCKALGVEVIHVVDAVEAGDAPADIAAVLELVSSLPGGRPDLAFRWARARRAQQATAGK